MSTSNNLIFKDLFIFDMANSHEGSLDHGLKIIDETAKVVKKHDIKASVKFQYRDLDTLIHPDFVKREDVKHIPRFLANRLSWENFAQMNDRVKEHGMISIVTPSDEISVDKCIEHEVDIIKVPSPAAMDWPLLRKISSVNKPIIVSTGGLNLSQIDEVVEFFGSRKCQFALEHCVSEYPMVDEYAQMNFLRRMVERYPELVIGWSGHEAPDNSNIGKAAIGAGAQILERHIGIPTEQKALNAYSMNPQEIDVWVAEMLKMIAIMGSDGDKVENKEELDSLRTLMRGVWAKQPIKRGEMIVPEQVFYAMPLQDDQLTSGEFGWAGVDFTASRDYAKGEAVCEEAKQLDEITKIVHDIKDLLREASITTGDNVEIELSHHFGLEQFRKTGAVIVNVLNREYCKKLIILFPGQSHPVHMHKVKEEAFHVLWGEIELVRDGEDVTLQAGDVAVVERGQWHSFASKHGVVFEEISTTHVKGDSYYKDPEIAQMELTQRKTVVGNLT